MSDFFKKLAEENHMCDECMENFLAKAYSGEAVEEKESYANEFMVFDITGYNVMQDAEFLIKGLVREYTKQKKDLWDIIKLDDAQLVHAIGLDKKYPDLPNYYLVNSLGIVRRQKPELFDAPHIWESYAREDSDQDAFREQEVFRFLDVLRRIGSTNMLGATPYIVQEFGISNKEAMKLLEKWIMTFDERHPQGESYSKEGQYERDAGIDEEMLKEAEFLINSYKERWGEQAWKQVKKFNPDALAGEIALDQAFPDSTEFQQSRIMNELRWRKPQLFESYAREEIDAEQLLYELPPELQDEVNYNKLVGWLVSKGVPREEAEGTVHALDLGDMVNSKTYGAKKWQYGGEGVQEWYNSKSGIERERLTGNGLSDDWDNLDTFTQETINYKHNKRGIKESHVGHKFTVSKPNLGLDVGDYEVVDEQNTHSGLFGSFSNITVKNVETGEETSVPLGNAQAVGLLPLSEAKDGFMGNIWACPECGFKTVSEDEYTDHMHAHESYAKEDRARRLLSDLPEELQVEDNYNKIVEWLESQGVSRVDDDKYWEEEDVSQSVLQNFKPTEDSDLVSCGICGEKLLSFDFYPLEKHLRDKHGISESYAEENEEEAKQWFFDDGEKALPMIYHRAKQMEPYDDRSEWWYFEMWNELSTEDRKNIVRYYEDNILPNRSFTEEQISKPNSDEELLSRFK